MTFLPEWKRQAILESVERRARHIAGANHARGAIPARCWRQSIAEMFLGEPVRDPEWAEAMIERCQPESSPAISPKEGV